jgi:hypothetical protein
MYAAGAGELDLAAAIDHYRIHGYARVGQVFDESTLTALRARADDLMLGRIELPGLFFQHESATGRYEDLPYGEGYVGPSLDYRKIEKLERDELFRAIIECELYERIVRQIIEGEVVLYRAVLFNKPAERWLPAAVAPRRRQVLGARPRPDPAALGGDRRRTRGTAAASRCCRARTRPAWRRHSAASCRGSRWSTPAPRSAPSHCQHAPARCCSSTTTCGIARGRPRSGNPGAPSPSAT